MNNLIEFVGVPQNVRKGTTIVNAHFYDGFDIYDNKVTGYRNGIDVITWFYKDFTSIQTVNANFNSQFAQLIFTNPISAKVKHSVWSLDTNDRVLNDVNRVLFCSGMYDWADANNFVKYLKDKIYPLFNKYKSEENSLITNTSSIADEIKQYKELLDIGAITQEEYDIKKKQLLNL